MDCLLPSDDETGPPAVVLPGQDKAAVVVPRGKRKRTPAGAAAAAVAVSLLNQILASSDGVDDALPSDDENEQICSLPEGKAQGQRQLRQGGHGGATRPPYKALNLGAWKPLSPYKVLELFSGTGSVGKVFRLFGHTVINVDITSAGGHVPTRLVDILNRDYKIYSPREFRFIWASPPCTHYSMARTLAKTPRDFPYYDGLVKKTLEIIDWFEPDVWIMENPSSGYLKTRPVVQGLPFKDIDYCSYGAVYRKRTRLWGRHPFNWEARQMCHGDCHACDAFGRHKHSAQRAEFQLDCLHAVPADLVKEIVQSIG